MCVQIKPTSKAKNGNRSYNVCPFVIVVSFFKISDPCENIRPPNKTFVMLKVVLNYTMCAANCPNNGVISLSCL